MTYLKKSLALLTVTALVIITLFSTLTAYANEPLGESKTEESVNTEIFTTEKDKEESENTRNLPEIDPIEDGAVYRIKNLQTGRYLTLEPNKNGVYDVTLNNIGTANYKAIDTTQEFRIVGSIGIYYIKPINSSNGTNRLVDVFSSNINQIVDGANVHLHPPGDENSSRWLIEYNSIIGSYVIKIECKPNLALTDASGNAQINSFSIANTAQYWIFERVEERLLNLNSGDIYRIRDRNSGLYLSVSGNDANLSNVELANGNDSLVNQRFRIVYDEANEMYYIKAVMSSNGTNRVLDIYSNPNSLPENGRNVHIYVIELFENYNSCGWQISKISCDRNGNNIVKICADYDESLVLTAANGNTSAGTNVRVNNYSGEENQKWVLEKYQSAIVNAPVAGTFEVGENVQLTTTTQINNLKWFSSDTTVATVSNTGFVRAVGNGNCKIYVYNEECTVVEICCNITVGKQIGEMIIVTAHSSSSSGSSGSSGSSSGGSSSSAGSLGHAFIVIKNTTYSNLNIGYVVVVGKTELALGTYGNSPSHNGLWYNSDLKTYIHNSSSSLVALTTTIEYEDLETINNYISQNDEYDLAFDNCSTFATGLWNAVSDIQLNAGVPNTPDNLENSIKENSDYMVGINLWVPTFYGYHNSTGFIETLI